MRFNKIFLIFVFLIFKAQIFCMLADAEEADIVNTRENLVVKPYFQKFFGPNFQRMAVGVSGGGYRSMISGIGLLAALEFLGLYNCITYTAGVSGGTWAILPISLRCKKPIEYAGILKGRMCQNITRHASKLQAIWTDFKCKWVDLWGAYIGERLIGDLPQADTLTFDTIRTNLKNNPALPFPIFTTVIGQTEPDYKWVEITPFRVYNDDWLCASIPTFALGSKFDGGSADLRSEKSLEFFMGLFGCAFCFASKDIVTRICEDFIDKKGLEPEAYATLHNRLSKIKHLLHHRHFKAKLPNYSFNMPESKMSKDKNLELIDAGYGCNLPIPPLLRPDRNIKIIFICDASAEAVPYTSAQLKKAAILAQEMGLKFPPLNRCKSKGRDLKIFYDEDPSIPMIIYFEHEDNLDKFPTVKMHYSETDFDEVYYDSYFAIIANQDLIFEAIKKKSSLANTFDAFPDVSC